MNSIKDLLLIKSFSLNELITQYQDFFLAILPSMFILALLVEYIDRLEPFKLVKRAFISILILTTIGSFYSESIESSIKAADEVLSQQKTQNILLMDMLDGLKQFGNLGDESKKNNFFKENGAFSGTIKFLKFHLFDSFINDLFTTGVYFITQLCLVIIKVVYSMVYYLGYGLIGIPCILYLFPTMGNVLRGGVLAYVWCLIVPHILVFILSLIGSEINQGYVSGQIIGGSMTGTVLLFILSLFIAFTPLIAVMILAGSGIASAGGIIATMGANYVMSLPRQATNTVANVLTGGSLGPKTALATSAIGGGMKLSNKVGSNLKNKFSNRVSTKGSNMPEKQAGTAIKDTQHISSFMKDLRMGIERSPTNSHKASRENIRPKFNLDDSSNAKILNSTRNTEVRGGKLQQYRASNNSVKKTNSIDRNYRSERKHTSSQHRAINSSKKRK